MWMQRKEMDCLEEEMRKRNKQPLILTLTHFLNGVAWVFEELAFPGGLKTIGYPEPLHEAYSFMNLGLLASPLDLHGSAQSPLATCSS